MEVEFLTVKLGLLSFWTVWFFTTFITNCFGGLKTLRLLPAGWRFASDNYEAIDHHVPEPFSGSSLSSRFSDGRSYRPSICVLPILMSVNTAFAAAAAFWTALMIADEIFLRYELESAHALLFVAGLATWMGLYVLPS